MGEYRTIVADPPWPIDDFPPNFGYEVGRPRPYSTMTPDEIRGLPVKQMANNRDGDALLYLWTISAHLRESYEVAEAWGFEPMYPLIWCKPPYGQGLGGKFASNVEFVLFCRRPGYTSVEKRGLQPDVAAVTSEIGRITREAGWSTAALNELVGSSDVASWWTSSLPQRCAIPKPEHWETLVSRIPGLAALDEAVAAYNRTKGKDRKPVTSLRGRVATRWFEWPRGRHSEKPEAFFDLVEEVSPGPYLELFARRARFGWDYWGDESLQTVELEGAA
jgi:N6-adenosine-specific RNA methylase IME4